MERFDQDVPVERYFAHRDLNHQHDLEELIDSLIYDLESGYFRMWEAVVREEQGASLTEDQEETLSGLMNFGDEDEDDDRVLYINDRARPDMSWYQIVRRIVPHLLREPFKTYEVPSEIVCEGWSSLVECLEEHGKGLFLPDGVNAPVDVVPIEMQHKLWLQSCFDALVGLGQVDELTLEVEDQRYRIPMFFEALQAHKDSIQFLDLSLEKLFTVLILPDKDREILIGMMREQLALTSDKDCIVARSNTPIDPPHIVVQQLFQAGQRMPVELRNRILGMESACVPALIDMLNDEDLQKTDAPGEGWAPIHAAALLGDLGAVEAIPSLMDWLQKVDCSLVIYGTLIHSLSQLGEPAVAPLLEAYHETEDQEIRNAICEAVARTGVRDDAIFNVLIEQLDENLELGTSFLAVYGDPQALPMLQQKLDEYEISDTESNIYAHQAVIELHGAIEELGGRPTPSQQAKYKHVMGLRDIGRKLLDKRMDSMQTVSQEPIRKERKLGRNEPCWCGSGKKYKRCHWASDRQKP